MRTSLPAAWMLVCLCVAMSGCGLLGPSESVAGNWTARSIGHSEFLSISLDQSGDDVSGVACGESSGVLLFSGARVHGDHPNVSFTVTEDVAQACCKHLVGVTFSGKLDKTGDIVGRYGMLDLRFMRTENGKCEGAR